MSIWREYAIPTVYRHLTRGLRWIWPDTAPSLPHSSAFTYRRYQLGVRPLHALFRQICRPQAQPTTPGAMLFGLRLMAIDGTVENLPDTPANAQVFGYPHNGHGGRDLADPHARAARLPPGPPLSWSWHARHGGSRPP